MKYKQIKKLAEKYLLPEMPDYVVHRHYIYKAPLEHFLRGFSFEGSSFSKGRFTVEAFVQPLFVPKEYITLSYGGRLGTLHGGHEKWWDLEHQSEEQIFSEVLGLVRNEGLPFLNQFSSPYEFARFYLPKAKRPHLWHMEAVGLSLVMAQEFDKAKEILVENCGYLEEAMKVDIYNSPHYPMIFDRDKEILRCLDEDVDEAFALLGRWEEYSLENLGLER